LAVTGEEQFEIIRKAWTAFSDFDLDGGLALVEEDAEVIPFGAAMEGRRYEGHEQIRRWFEQEIWSSWEWFQTIPEEYRLVDNRLLVYAHWRARGRESGIDLDIPATWVVKVTDGKIKSWQTFTDRDEALRAVGLEP
jgi:ketosteroid isomerase-like protein